MLEQQKAGRGPRRAISLKKLGAMGPLPSEGTIAHAARNFPHAIRDTSLKFSESCRGIPMRYEVARVLQLSPWRKGKSSR